MEDVEALFNSLGLGQYIPACEHNGYDHLGCILEHDDEDLDILGAHVGMVPGHVFLLKQAVKEMKRIKKNTGRVRMIQFNGPRDGIRTGGPVAGAAAAAATTPVVVAAAAADYDMSHF